MLKEPINSILAEVASASPAPGGGSVSALVGANGAALVSMVCRLTIGKKKYLAVSEEMEQVLGKTEALREELANLFTEDSNAFDGIKDARALPKETPEQIEARKQAIEVATKVAIQVPLKTMRACAATIELAEVVAEKGNATALSDVGVAALVLEAGALGARLNVLINLSGLEDRTFAESCLSEANAIMAKVRSIKERMLGEIEKRLQ
ncbi:MAG: cyclodeaminase/cyclohydrolase family protein [Bacillota bacterium]